MRAAVYLSGRGGAYVTGAVIPLDGGIWAAAAAGVREISRRRSHGRAGG
jgi:hypothetical protein